jgi:ABC-2 type transport system ATP-binding protein
MILAQGLVKHFGAARAVDGLSFEVGPGEIYGLLGPNGAGKTTTTRILSCLLRPTAGTAYVAGHRIDREARTIRGKIGVLTELPGLYTRLTPIEYLDFFGQVQGVAGAGRRGQVERVLHLVGMWDRRDSIMRTFSKGLQQRIAIARALLHEPEVLLFDEPTAALDPEAARAVRDHLRELAADRKRSVLLCTHNLSEAEHLCHRLSIVQHGRQLAEGTPDQLRAGLPRSVILRVGAATPDLLRRLQAVPGVANVTAPANGRIAFRTSRAERIVPEVVRTAVSAGADVLGLAEEEPPLEDVYLAFVRDTRVEGPVA